MGEGVAHAYVVIDDQDGLLAALNQFVFGGRNIGVDVGLGEKQRERGAHVGRAVHLHESVGAFDEVLHHRQTQAGALVGLLGREEWLVDAGDHLGCHAHAVVLHFKHDVVAQHVVPVDRLVAYRQANRAPTAHRIPRIDREVDERVLQIHLVHQHVGGSVLHVHGEVGFGSHGLVEQLLDFFDQASWFHRRQALRLAAAESHQLRREPRRLLDVGAHVVGRVLERLVLQRLEQLLGIEAHDEQQIVQVMRHTAGEVGDELHLLRTGQQLVGFPQQLLVAFILALQLADAFAKALLHLDKLLDVDARARPIQDLAGTIPNRAVERQVPVKLAHAVAQAVAKGHHNTVDQRLGEDLIAAGQVVRMDLGDPVRVTGVVNHRLVMREQVGGLVDPEHLPLGAAHPCIEGEVLQHGLELIFELGLRRWLVRRNGLGIGRCNALDRQDVAIRRGHRNHFVLLARRTVLEHLRRARADAGLERIDQLRIVLHQVVAADDLMLLNDLFERLVRRDQREIVPINQAEGNG